MCVCVCMCVCVSVCVCVCVCVRRHLLRTQIICAILCSHMWAVCFPQNYYTLLQNWHDFRKNNITEYQIHMFRIPVKFFKTFLNIRDIQGCNILLHRCVHMKCPLLLFELNET